MQIFCGKCRLHEYCTFIISEIIVYRSKRTLGWRTCLIIPELEGELAVAKQEQLLAHEMLKLRQLQYDLDDYIDILRLQVKSDSNIQTRLSDVEAKAVEVKQKVRDVTTEYNRRYYF